MARNLLIVLLVFAITIWMEVWKESWSDLDEVYPIRELLETNLELKNNQNLNLELPLLSSEISSILIPMHIASQSAALIEISQTGKEKVSATVPSIDGNAVILYKIDLPANINFAKGKINVSIKNESENGLGLTVIEDVGEQFNKLNSRTFLANQELEGQAIQLSIHYKDLGTNAPLIRDYTNPVEIIYVAWRNAIGRSLVSGILLAMSFAISFWIWREMYRQGLIDKSITIALGIVFLFYLFF